MGMENSNQFFLWKPCALFSAGFPFSSNLLKTNSKNILDIHLCLKLEYHTHFMAILRELMMINHDKPSLFDIFWENMFKQNHGICRTWVTWVLYMIKTPSYSDVDSYCWLYIYWLHSLVIKHGWKIIHRSP